METNKKLQKLIGNAIGKDYFKLEWGCKVANKGDEELKEIGMFVMTSPVIATSETDYKYAERDGLHLWLYEVKESPQVFTLENFNKWYKIIGQEPTLNDVLLAIYQKTRVELDNNARANFLEISKECQCYCHDELASYCTKCENESHIHIAYNLPKSLFNQEESVKVAIINLLEDK